MYIFTLATYMAGVIRFTHYHSIKLVIGVREWLEKRQKRKKEI